MTQSQHALALDQSPSIFNFGDHAVRIVVIDGEPWFVCVDVATALGYRNAPDAARHLDADEKGTHILRTLSPDEKGRGGGDQHVTIINESGLYALVLRSRKSEARKFAKWVTSEVLPSIRKTGGYGTADPARQTRANSLAAAMAGMAYRFAHEAVTEGREMDFRLMLTFTCNTLDGKSLVPWGQVMVDDGVSALERLTKTLLMPNGIYPTDVELIELASACVQRLNQRIAYRAAR